MCKSDGEGGLRMLGIDCDAGRLAAARLAAVGANDQARCNSLSAGKDDRCTFRIAADVLDAFTAYR